MTEKYLIRTLTQNDMSRVAEIHAQAFPESLITKLGLECTRRYYQWQIDSPDNVQAMGAYDGETLLGFCFGGVFTMALGGFITRNKWFIFNRLLLRPWLLAHPYFIKKFYHGFKLLLKFSNNQATQNEAILGDEPYGILAIASDSRARGRGVGQLLMRTSERYAVENDFKMMRLTVNPKNTNAIQFYEHIGWVKDDSPGEWNGRFYKSLIDDE
jgi:ribosomal protein S18 acetylase RimI-like enzyme